ncbi:DUF3551 domain-containing protein [Bradyrhizobium sp. USDA 4486]
MEAQTYDPRQPVCIEVYTLDGSSIACSFMAMAKCAATASGQSAQCFANPYAVQNRHRARAHRRRDGTAKRLHPLSARGSREGGRDRSALAPPRGDRPRLRW